MKRRALLLASLVPTILPAQTSHGLGEERATICVPTLRIWTGTIQETGQIHQVPVPESFKTGSGGGCGGPVFAEFLVTWHLRFGDEGSVTDALNFIDARDGEPHAVAARIEREWAMAMAGLTREIERTRADYDNQMDKEGSDPVTLNKAFEQRMRALLAGSPSVRRMTGLKDDLQRILLVRANLYLSAAEVFQSRSLAEEAQVIYALHQAIEGKMLPKRDGGTTIDENDIQQALEQIQDHSVPELTSMEIDLRLAVLRAQLYRTPEALSKVRTALDRRYKPAFANAPKVAFGGGDDFCDLRSESFLNDWEREIAAACKDDYAFFPKAMAYGYAESMLGILADSGRASSFGHWDWEDYVTLAQKDVVNGSELHGFILSPEDRVVALKLELADREFKNSMAKTAGKWSLEQAWQYLLEISPMANPVQNPVRFRKIAQLALAVGVELQKQDEGWKQKTAPMMAYYRLNLGNLDKLVVGQTS
ncbi:MAG: hypothetical protein KGL44_07340 [Sphingomonadales bacterium]|nr:hypothetical protein [Sphingomonadales bacterium]